MDKETLIEILNGWNFWKADRETGIFRESYLERFYRLLKTEQIVAITGVRRSGKSTLLKQFIKRQIAKGEDRTAFLYVNFDEPKFAGLLSLEFLQQIYDAYLEIVRHIDAKPYVFLDEVQNVPEWERFVRGLHEKNEAHVFVSGSTAKLLGPELGTLLTGRWVELRTYPLDFGEFLQFNQIKVDGKMDLLSKKVKIKQLLREFLEFGGFPLVSLKKDERDEILRRYLDDVVERDIVARHKIRKPEKLRALVKYYLTNCSSHISYRRIAKFLGLSLDSIERFSSYMRDAGFIFFVPRFSYSLKEQEANPKIAYCIDAGLINVGGFRFIDNVGKLYENAVFLSLIKSGKEIYYYKGGGECDFVVKDGQRVIRAIQVSYRIKENKEREVDGLIEAMEAFKLKEGFIITDDLEGEENVHGRKIIYRPLWKWLLE